MISLFQVRALVSFLSCCATVTAELRSVHTKTGYVAGVQHDNYVAFKGVPYAKPPVGELRFKRPEPLDLEPGTITCDKYPPVCPQSGRLPGFDGKKDLLDNQSEDCLYLNVFTPDLETEGAYPVLVWIHGGSFVAGAGHLDMNDSVISKRFVQRDVVLITLNYRLGMLGFMVGDSKKESNMGLWDIIEALRWVNDNIYLFGGDPDRVTIMGESAGGAAASILALTPETHGLVHRAIIMSGSILAHFGARFYGHEETVDYRFACEQITCDEKNTEREGTTFSVAIQEQCCSFLPEKVNCGDLSPQACVVRNGSVFSEMDSWEVFRACLFAKTLPTPIVDEQIILSGKQRFAREMPRMPVMLGVADFEWGLGLAYEQATPVETIRKRVSSIYPPHLREDITNSIAHFYLEEPNVAGDQETKLKRAVSDVEMVAPVHAEAMNYANQDQPVYLYSFKRAPDAKMLHYFKKRADGEAQATKVAFHGLDHAYLFTEGSGAWFKFEYDDVDHQVADNFTQYIVNFATFGTPDAPDTPVTWPRFTKENQSYVEIDHPIEAHEKGFHQRGVHFFNQFLPKLLGYAEPGADQAVVEEKGSIFEPKSVLSEEEKSNLAAYKQSWWILWALVIATALALLILLCFLCYRAYNKKRAIKTRTVATMTYRSV